VLIAILGNPQNELFGNSAFKLYDGLFAFVLRSIPTFPKVLIPSFIPAYVMTLTVILGAVTAFLMPPVDSTKSHAGKG
jgi:hypothetical protein